MWPTHGHVTHGQAYIMWNEIDLLSDDEGKSTKPSENHANGVDSKRLRGPRSTPAKGGWKKRRMLARETQPGFSYKSLRHLVASGCGCKCNCFQPFRDKLFDQLAHMRRKMAMLPKLQSDEYVWAPISD